MSNTMLPTLYSRTSKGKIQQWQVEVEGNKFRAISGQKDGKLVISKFTECSGKNSGKTNETTPEEQALAEAKALWQKKINKGYYEKIEDIDNEMFFEPMLAKNYNDRKDKLTFPLYVQPKLDGCLDEKTMVKTKEYGEKTIKEIVDNKLKVKVKSFNIQKNRVEYKEVLNWSKNLEDIKEKSNDWYEIELEDGSILKLTGNHRVYLPELKCYRETRELDGTEKLLKF